MACVALASLMATIRLEFLHPTPRVPLHHQSPIIQSFIQTISSLQAFLEKSSGGGGAKVRDLEIEIKDFALIAEDAIEIQLSKFLLAEDADCQYKAFHELHQTLQEAAELLLNILNTTTTISNEEVDDEANESIQDFELDGSLLCHPPRLLDNKMVGREDDYRTIKFQVLDRNVDHSELKLIWIVGMPGIGKTTLAESVYEDPEMKQVFEVQVWITMPPQKNYNHREILCNLLLSIAAPTTELSEIVKGSTSWELANQVRKHLMGTRFLIVLDNLWNFQAWHDIVQCFPDNQNGSRVMLTTTHFDRDSCASSFYHIHNLTLLNSTHSWDIFCNIILSLNGHMAPIFEKIRSIEIVEKCDGLPQLIVAVAKRLSTCDNIQLEGKRIEKELDSIGILDRTALDFVFNQLPLHLKVCFLYLGAFPKRSEILVKMLFRLWSAEGFVSSEYEASLYLQELIDRSLVLIGNRSSFDGKIKTCRIHGSLHSFCVGETQKEGIFCAVNTQQHLGLPLDAFANSCRWLSFYTHSFDYYVLFSTNYSRSIFFFQENSEMFAPSNLLRVLAFVSPPFLQRFPNHLGNLVFLRYLSVTQWFEGLDDIVSANPNLQTLIVSHSESQLGAPTLHLPSTIWEPPQLRHLGLGDMYTVDPPSVRQKNLQTLSWVVAPTHCGKELYINFPFLRKLKIFCKEDLKPDGSSNNHIILDHFKNTRLLERLTIRVSMGCTTNLPELFPSFLKKMKLSGTDLSETDLSVIGRLFWLKYLKLQDVSLGRVWRVANGEFSNLRFLLLEDKKLEQFMVGNESFPSLERLVLRSCYRLEEIPYDFAFSSHLKSVELDKHLPSVFSTAKLILEWQWRLGRDRFELIVDGAKYVDEQFAGVIVEQDLIDIGGFFTVGPTNPTIIPTKLIFLLVLYIAGIIFHVLLYRPISNEFVITSFQLPLKGNNWILAIISTCLACIGFIITVISS